MVFVGVLLALGAGALFAFRTREWARSDWIGLLRCVLGLCSIYLLAANPGFIQLILPFLPLGLMPVRGRDWQPADVFPRVFVTSLAAMQFLEAYPVAGSRWASRPRP